MNLQIRTLHSPAEMEEVQDLQRLVWPGSEADVIPVHVLLTFAHNGGLVLGAYDGQQLAGISIGFPGLYPTPAGLRAKHCSHELGVHPHWRDSGVGYALKCAQREQVRAQNLALITWTYDPLLSRNAHLNIARLGAVCNTYLREVYGEMRDGLNAGLASDRFQVDWWIDSPRVAQRLEANSAPRRESPEDLPRLYPVLAQKNFIAPAAPPPVPSESRFLVEIPPDFLALKAADFALARDWRFYTREVFENCFRCGYSVSDFLYSPHPARSFYLLEKIAP
ncbi:MAG: hypothetical protein OHK0031_16280 [Anaerolineales bacterium]